MIQPLKFEVNEHRDGGACTMSITGELDMNTVAVLAERVGSSLASGSIALTLDLRGLSFMDSSGLRMLIELNDQSKREGWRLTLAPPTDEAAAMVLRVTGGDKELPFRPEANS